MSVKVVEVEVKVGIASVADGVFKARRGKTHCVTVKSSADKEEITRKAVEKHSSFDQTFDGTVPYVLLFPDFSQVNSRGILVIVMSLSRSSWKTFLRLMGLAYLKKCFAESDKMPFPIFHNFQIRVFMYFMRNDGSYDNTAV